MNNISFYDHLTNVFFFGSIMMLPSFYGTVKGTPGSAAPHTRPLL